MRNTIKAVFRDNQFQTIGELRALLSLYNMTVEEVRGNAKGEDYNGLVYSVIDANGEKIGNPFKSSLFGKSVGYEALQRKATFSKKNIKEKNLTEPTRKTLEYALRRTYDKNELMEILKEKGIDCVFRYTDEGRLYGATFIDHRTHCVLNGSRMGKEFSANSLDKHFNTPIEEQHPFLNTKVTNKSGIMTAIRIPTAVRVKRNSHLMTAVLNTAIAHRVPRPSLMPLTSSIPITLLRMPKKRHSDADFSARRKSVVVQDCNHRLLITTKFKVLCNKKMI